MYAEYRQAELKHSEQEQSLSTDIDSLLKVNDERQARVDSLNRVVNNLEKQINVPSPQAILDAKARQMYAEVHLRQTGLPLFGIPVSGWPAGCHWSGPR